MFKKFGGNKVELVILEVLHVNSNPSLNSEVFANHPQKAPHYQVFYNVVLKESAEKQAFSKSISGKLYSH